MQSVNFTTVGELLDFLPEDQRLMTEQLRDLILTHIDGVQERLSYNVPFFRRRYSICYIWPGAVPWGNKTSEGVEMGFNNGYLLTDPGNYLDRGARKQIYTRRFLQPEEIDERILAAYLQEAAELDELLYQEKMIRRREAK